MELDVAKQTSVAWFDYDKDMRCFLPLPYAGMGSESLVDSCRRVGADEAAPYAAALMMQQMSVTEKQNSCLRKFPFRMNGIIIK